MTEIILNVREYPYHFYYQQNSSAKVNWLFLHGFMGNHHDFDQILDYLPGTVWTVDLLGFGNQAPLVPRKRLSMESQIIDFEIIFQHFNWQNLNLVGYSMGGRLALGLAQSHLADFINCLVLESSTAGLDSVQRRQERQLQDEQRANALLADYRQFVQNWRQLPLFASQKLLPVRQQVQIQHERLNQKPDNMANSLRMMGTGSQPNFWPKLKNLKSFTGLIVGENDFKFIKIAQKLSESIPDAELTVVKNAGHNVHLEQPGVYQEILQQICIKSRVSD